ncbi:MAG: LPS-assembly protein LptD, partial [Rhodospirillales bacterium]|nr:LPS-assembly protein LptD [Rhodospirillales bacterium]
MMPRFLGRMIAIWAASAGVVAAPAAFAATAGGADPNRPLGTLWYPGPYQQPAPAPVAAPPPVPQPAPLPHRAPEPAPAPAPVAVPAPSSVGGPEPGKPLGTLWYPGAYDPAKPAGVPVPSPVIAPSPAPPRPRVPDDKPLGTLWYPGPYDTGAITRPVPEPAAALQPTAGAPLTPVAPRSAAGAGKTKIDPSLPVQLSADEMRYDQEQGLVTASGNVEIIHGQRRLRADTVTYNQKTDIVSATGNISLTEPGGERIFGDRMEITGDLRDATIEAIGIIMTDRSRIAAAGARRSAGVVTEMRQGVYSPCELCKTDPTRPPLWQVKA